MWRFSKVSNRFVLWSYCTFSVFQFSPHFFGLCTQFSVHICVKCKDQHSYDILCFQWLNCLEHLSHVVSTFATHKSFQNTVQRLYKGNHRNNSHILSLSIEQASDCDTLIKTSLAMRHIHLFTHFILLCSLYNVCVSLACTVWIMCCHLVNNSLTHVTLNRPLP